MNKLVTEGGEFGDTAIDTVPTRKPAKACLTTTASARLEVVCQVFCAGNALLSSSISCCDEDVPRFGRRCNVLRTLPQIRQRRNAQ